MAQITTHNAAQREVAQRFVEAYVQAEGEEFASDLVIVGKANHRFAITMPGDDGHTEYTYSGMKELIEEYETRGSAVSQIAALAGGMAAPSILSNEVAESATISAQVGDEGEPSDEDGDGVAGVGDDADVDGDAPVGDGVSGQGEVEAEGEGDDSVLFTGGAELPDLEDGVDDGATQASGDGGDGGEEQEDGETDGGDEPGEGDTGEPGDDEDGQVSGGAEGSGSGAGDDEVSEPEPEEGATGDSEEDSGAEESDLKEQAKEKVRSQNKGKKSKKSHAISSLIAAMLKHSDAGAQGKLALAEDLYDLDRIAKEEGLNRNEQLEIAQSFFESKGRKFPDKSSRSKLKTVWETWFADTGYDLSQELTSERLVDAHGVPKTTKPDSDELLPMPLASQDYNTLYVARNLVEGGEDEHNATLMAMINTFSYKTIAKVAQHLDFDTMTPQFDEWLKIQDPVKRENVALSWADSKKGVVASDYKSISVLASTYEQFMGMIPRMTELAIEAGIHEPVEGKESSVSKAFVLDMLIATWEEFTDSDKVLFIKLHHGSISAEEYTQLTGKEMDIEVEGVPAD